MCARVCVVVVVVSINYIELMSHHLTWPFMFERCAYLNIVFIYHCWFIHLLYLNVLINIYSTF